MAILSVGVSYRRAQVALLERLAFAEEDLPKAYHHLGSLEGVRGTVIVSTCNRVEILAEVDSYHEGLQALRSFLADSREVATEELSDALVAQYEDDAVRHVFALAAGIESMVVGEAQILAQLRDAYRHADEEQAPSPLLAEVFRRAVRAGRRARAETGIGASPAAMVEAGAAVAERTLGSLAGTRVLVVGAGVMAELAVATLGGRGAIELTVLNRTPSKAERMALRAGGTSGTLEDLDEGLGRADLVVTLTGATGLVIGVDAVRRALAERDDRPMFFLDLAVPRDVDPSARELPGVGIADIDDLRAIVNGADGDEVEKVRAIVEDEASRFAAWRRTERVVPIIQALYDRAEYVRRSELARIEGRLARLGPEERAAVEAATTAMVKKLLHRPVTRVKELAEDDTQVRLLARLFGLDPPPPA